MVLPADQNIAPSPNHRASRSNKASFQTSVPPCLFIPINPQLQCAALAQGFVIDRPVGGSGVAHAASSSAAAHRAVTQKLVQQGQPRSPPMDQALVRAVGGSPQTAASNSLSLFSPAETAVIAGISKRSGKQRQFFRRTPPASSPTSFTLNPLKGLPDMDLDEVAQPMHRRSQVDLPERWWTRTDRNAQCLGSETSAQSSNRLVEN